MKNKNIKNGYTFIEVMIVLMIISIISFISYPFFNDIIQKQKVDNLTNQLYLDIRRAKNIAIMNNTTITIESISGNSWNNWRVRKSNGEIIFRKGTGVDTGFNVVASHNFFSFNHLGQIKRSNSYLNQVSFKVCSGYGNNEITINSLGKMNVQEIARC